MLRMRTALLLAAATAASLASHASAADFRRCAPPPDVEAVDFRSLPTDVYQALQQQAGRIRDIRDGDVHIQGAYQDDFSSHPLFVWRAGRRWVVATDRLSPSYSIKVYGFTREPQGQAVGLEGVRAAFPTTACRAATDLVLEADRRGR